MRPKWKCMYLFFSKIRINKMNIYLFTYAESYYELVIEDWDIINSYINRLMKYIRLSKY